MGAGPSRGISLRNPEPPAKIIQITEDVAKRMTNKYGQNPVTDQAAGSQSRPSAPSGGRAAESEYVAPEPPVPQQQGGLLNVGAKGFPVVETVTAYQVRQQKEVELRENDLFWGSKLRELEARYVAAAFAAEGEFNKELEKLDKLVPKPMEPVCQNHTAKVAQCYQENSKQALKCSEVVKEFALCVKLESQKVNAPVAA